MLWFSLDLAGAALAHGERRERGAACVLTLLASFLPTRMQPGGCFLSAVSFNLCYFCPDCFENSHLNRHTQYHTLAQTQQRTIRHYAGSGITHTNTLDFTLIRHLVWLLSLRPAPRPLAVMSSLPLFFFFSRPLCPSSSPPDLPSNETIFYFWTS